MANNLTAKDMQQKNYDGNKKGERNRITPISSSDIRKKAKTREFNSIDMQRDNLLASNSTSYRANNRKSYQKASVSRRELVAKSPEKRSQPSASNGRKNTSQNSFRSSKRSSGKAGAKQTTQPVYTYSPVKTKGKSTTTQVRQRVNTTSYAGNKSTARKSNGSNNRQNPQARELATPSRKQNVTRSNSEVRSSQRNTQSRSAGQSQKSRGSKSSQRTQPAPAPRQQTKVRKQPAPVQKTHSSTRNTAVPVKSSNKGSTRKNAARTSNTNKSSGKRSANSRKRN